MTSSTPLASITSYYVPLGSQVTSWMHLQTFSCLWKSTAWLSLGHFKPRMPIMNSSSFSQQPYSPLTFSISMKGRVSTKQRKAKPLEVVVDWNWSFSCQIHLLDSPFDRLLSSFFFFPSHGRGDSLLTDLPASNITPFYIPPLTNKIICLTWCQWFPKVFLTKTSVPVFLII